MNGMNELITIAKYMERWHDQRFVCCVFNNRDLNQVTWEQRALAGDPKFEASQSIPDFPAARYAELVGLHGIKVDGPEGIRASWESALGAGRPSVLEVVVDPEVAPLPPHITLEQARAMTSAVAKGDSMVALTRSLRSKVREFLPGR
jgi:pyruvate dehydrogenase (quinone)